MLIEIENYGACVIRSALKHYHNKVSEEYETLIIANERELTEQERETLPPSLVDATRPQLEEQINAWYSLLDTIEYYQEEFDF